MDKHGFTRRLIAGRLAPLAAWLLLSSAALAQRVEPVAAHVAPLSAAAGLAAPLSTAQPASWADFLGANPNLIGALDLPADAAAPLQRILETSLAPRSIMSLPPAAQVQAIRQQVRMEASAAFIDRRPSAYSEQWFERREQLLNDLEKVRPALAAARSSFWDGGVRRADDEEAAPLAAAAAPSASAARSGLERPRRMAASKQEWQSAALKDAGIEVREWMPERGFARNRRILEKVYDWYALANRRFGDRLEWAGQAKLAGGSVYRGLKQLQRLKLLLPGDSVLKTADATLLQMNKAIFMDLGWQIKAYMDGGLDALRRARDAGELSHGNFLAWRAIDTGQPELTHSGNMALLRREQELVVAPGYEKLKTLKRVPREMSRRLESPVPGGRAFQAAAPRGDLTDFGQRWDWILQEVVASWSSLKPQERERLVGLPLSTLAKRRFEPQRRVPRGEALKAAAQKIIWTAALTTAVVLPAVVAFWAQPFANGAINLLIVAGTAAVGAFAYGRALRRVPFSEAKRILNGQIRLALCATAFTAFLAIMLDYMIGGPLLTEGIVSEVALHHFLMASAKLAGVAGALFGALSGRKIARR